jgi:thiamine transport system substrate-binding protein
MRTRASRLLAILAALAMFAAACGSDTPAADTAVSETSTTNSSVPDASRPAEPVTITLVTHDSFVVSEDLLNGFLADTGITVELLPAGDAGEALNQSILSAGNPLGDVFFGVDNTFLSRALDADIFVPYESPLLASIPDELELDPEHRLLPADFGDVCLNYDKSAFADGAPEGLADLAEASFHGQLVVQNPATSSPGLAFLLATIVEFGEEGDYTWQDYWTDLRANDVSIQAGWSEAYYGDFTVGGGGDRPIVVSYASSPPAEVIFAEEPMSEAPTAVIESSCFRQIEFVGVLAGTEHEDAARQLVDFLLSVPLQEDIPLNMFVFPANSEAALPQEFLDHTVIPTNSKSLDPKEIEANRERWIEEWTEIALR